MIIVKSLNLMKIVPISEKISQTSAIYLSEKCLKQWKLKRNSHIFFSLGKQSLKIKIVDRNIHDNEIHICESLLNKLNLPLQSYTFNVEYSFTSQTLIIAPLIGLLTDINEDDPSDPHFRSVHSFCEELDFVTKEMGGFFYVFPLQNLGNDHITGFYLSDGTWSKSILPIPDVIYNRIHSRKLEASEAFGQFRKQLQALQIPFFNDRFLSKWDVYDILKTEEHLLPYTPISMLYTKNNLEYMLSKHPILFLKPIHGSQGKKIIRIHQYENYYQVQFSHFKNQMDKLTLSSLGELVKHISPYLKKTKYLIQQGIEFIQHQNRLIDFRVLCHKNKQDTWRITSIVARLSAEQQFVSNIARGGETMKALQALLFHFDSRKSKLLYTLMKELALEFSSVISQNSEGLTGELGIDIGIDLDGHLWFIEANSKPSKNFEQQEIKIRPSAKAIITYCFKLAIDHAHNKEAES
jgi:glutathione synthase/RimK-type ligase-like ATP-grasp enzyme